MSQAALSLSVVYTNIRSLLPKRDTLCSFLDDSDPDILVLTETWLNPDICDNEILPDNNLYKIYRNDRIDRRGGGVLVAIKKTLQSYCIDNTSSLEIVWAAFPMSSGTILIGACYRAPASDNSFLNSLRDRAFLKPSISVLPIMFIFLAILIFRLSIGNICHRHVTRPWN